MSIENELISGLKKFELARRAGGKTIQAIRLDTLALSICSQKILEHPAGWLNYELRTIASYIQAYAKQLRIIYVNASQRNESSINKRLGLKGNITSGLRALSIFKPNCMSKPKKKHHEITNNNDLPKTSKKPKK